MRKLICSFLCCLGLNVLHAQQLLQTTVTIEVKKMPLGKVLEEMGKQGKFYFSYNSSLIRGDSLVTISMPGHTVRQVLDHLFGGTIRYQVSGNYVILQSSPPLSSQYWYISGYIRDAVSGEKISSASIYERQQLAGTISNEDGFFRLRLKDKYRSPSAVAISISRVAYADTFVTVHAGQDEQLSVSLVPVSGELTPLVLAPRVERNWLTRLFLSSSQTIQSLNLRNFFASRPYQVSFIPGLGTHGKMGAQVVNKVSLNVLGGYTAGSNGLEMAGLFNIDKKEVKYVQLAGLFNMAGANARGLQMAGLHNQVQDSVNGWQLAGLNNVVRTSLRGVQAAGIYNYTGGSVKGVQLAGISNTVNDSATGVQVAGVVNHVHATMNGTQAAFVVNYARHVKGVQIGLINISDTLSGYSIGLITIARKGYHQLCIATNDLLDMNLTYKAGNRKLYSMVSVGFNIGAVRKAYGFGYGLGNETRLGRRLLLSNELLFQQLYIGSWDSIPELIRYQPSLHWQLNKRITLHTGPSFWMGDPEKPEPGYAAVKPRHVIARSGPNRLWLGWQLGLQLF